jgi:hypothetical protein
MTALAWIAAYVAVVPVVAVVVGRLIRRRERQVPKCSRRPPRTRRC